MGKIDLHIHSKFSDDGEFEVREIIDKAISNGVSTISITDHNSAKANEIAVEYAKTKGIKYISGIEIDCQYKGLNLHLLGYDFQFFNNSFLELEENVFRAEKEAGIKRIEKIRSCTGLFIDEEEVLKRASNGIITGEVIGEVLLEDERNKDSEILIPYREGGERSDMPFVNFYWDFFSQGKPAYVHIEFITLKDAIKLIKSSGGVAIIAHPGNNLKKDLNLIDELVHEGIDGIEVFSSYHSENDIKFFYDRAIKNNLIITCGTDFHGKNKPNIDIGKFNREINFENICSF